MEYIFVAPIYGLDLRRVDSGLRLDKMYISNSIKFLKKSVFNSPFPEVLGNYSMYDFYDDRDENNIKIGNYFYWKDNITDIETMEELQIKQFETGFATTLTNVLLVECQNLLVKLWLLRDNSIYCRDGFICFYPENDSPRIFKYSLQDIYYDINLTKNPVNFLKHEIVDLYKQQKSDSFNLFSDLPKNNSTEYLSQIIDKYYLNLNIFSKKGKHELNKIASNIDKAHYFIKMARSEVHTDLKIFFFISAMESLLMSDSKSEITHQISEKIAHLIGDTLEEKINIYDTIKRAYSVRSSVSHGSEYKLTDEKLIQICNSLDTYLRLCLTEYLTIFQYSKEELNNHFKLLCLK